MNASKRTGKAAASGLTLIELMIILGVLSLLVAVAVPAYRDYQVRSMVAEAIGMVDPVLTSVVEYYFSSDSVWPGDNIDAGLSAPGDYQTQYVNNIEVQPDGFVIVTLSIDGLAPGTTIEWEGLEDNGNVEWDCTGGTLGDQYRPFDCR